MNPTFIGEHLLPGKLGHFSAILAFVAALLSAFSYWQAVRAEKFPEQNRLRSWLRLGRSSFIIHSLSVLSVFIALYVIISGHLFEYHYAWEHSSRSLPSKYLLSCFWEGQQGSFLLWTFWHCVLSMFVMWKGRSLESRTMVVISLVQAALVSFVLGFYFGPDIQIGKTPFMLLRDAMAGAPIFSQPNYLDFVKDGNGLNPLLQNYWMVIHPPILFLGFAATLFPFAYLIAALWKGEYQSFLKPLIGWSLFAGGVLGLGIMMGGAWAYESLNFGGYWAWDPVENASLVPWLTLVAGLHTALVYRSTGRSFGATVLLIGISHVLIWYSTFLTRTGILGDSSVHAFTGEGASIKWHLLIVLLAVGLTLLVAYLIRKRRLPRAAGEEQLLSREFWMFVGAFVLLLSAGQIIVSTSIPVWAPLAKWISGKDIAPPTEPLQHYNTVQIWIAIVLGLLSSAVLFLKYKTTSKATALKRWGITGLLALALALGLGYWQHIPFRTDTLSYILLLFAASWTVMGSLYYAFTIGGRSIRKMGPSMAHLGFGVLLLGILFSSFNKEVISLNTLGVNLDFGKNAAENARESRENVLLYKDVPVAMGDYFATYKGDSTDPKDPRTFYRVDYQRINDQTREVKERFTLYPDAFVNPKGQEGIIANPDSKHYWDRDVFTYVSSVSAPAKEGDTAGLRRMEMKPNDTLFMSKAYLVFRNFDGQVDASRYAAQPGDVALRAQVDVYNLNGKADSLQPIFYVRERFAQSVPDTAQTIGVSMALTQVNPETGAGSFEIREEDPTRKFVVLKAILFPGINLVWIGTIVMVLGFLLSLWNRQQRKSAVVVA
ncbi:MAG: cytochrome c assembly protein [Sphingobacteriales bacterium]|nr:MAG: cytochrome c assembly protein [Sphingobacteriales bacterium]